MKHELSVAFASTGSDIISLSPATPLVTYHTEFLPGQLVAERTGVLLIVVQLNNSVWPILGVVSCLHINLILHNTLN